MSINTVISNTQYYPPAGWRSSYSPTGGLRDLSLWNIWIFGQLNIWSVTWIFELLVEYLNCQLNIWSVTTCTQHDHHHPNYNWHWDVIPPGWQRNVSVRVNFQFKFRQFEIFKNVPLWMSPARWRNVSIRAKCNIEWWSGQDASEKLFSKKMLKSNLWNLFIASLLKYS